MADDEQTHEPAGKEPTDKDRALLTRIRRRYQLMTEHESENRREAQEDLEFATVPGEQWEQNMKRNRGNRPCYEFNKVRVTGKRIINEIRQNRPAGKVRGVEGSDKKTAEIYEGLIRNIWNVSDGDTVLDYQAEYQVFGGMGAWRITTEYADDHAFEQDIRIESFANPFCLYADPAAKDIMKRDAMDWLVTERIPRKEYEERYPDARIVDFEENEFDDSDDWQSDETVRIGEYWWKEPAKMEIWKLADGKVIDADSDEAKSIQQLDKSQIVAKRTVDTHVIKWVIVSGDAVLDGPGEWAGKQFPFVMVFGEYLIADGELRWHGITRFAKDPQRSYNFARTAISETIAMAPQAKVWATPAQAKGLHDQWSKAHYENIPWMLYNPDPNAPGPPVRVGSADIPMALIQESQLASKEIDDVTGIYGDDRGDGDSRSQSGRAIYARQQQGRVVTFNYQDNAAKAIRRTWEILIDLIPQVYDTERELRILGSDEAEDYVRVNTLVPDPDDPTQVVKVNDLATGRFDVTVTVGPGFASRRQEATETYLQLLQTMPDAAPLVADLVFRSMDLPYAEDIAERFKAVAPPEVRHLMGDDKEGQQQDPAVVAAMQQAETAMAQVQEAAGMIEQERMALEAEKAQAGKDRAEVEQQIAKLDTTMAELDTAKAQFEAKTAQVMADIAKREAGVIVKETELGAAVNAEAVTQAQTVLSEQVAGAVDVINTLTAEFMGQAGETLETLRGTKSPRVAEIRAERRNGQLVAVPIYAEDNPPQPAPGG